MKPDAGQLDTARRDWLAGLASAHRRAATTDTSLALAQGEWLCGDYDEAIAHFIEAGTGAPDHIPKQLALVRAASMLGLDALEAETLSVARARHPNDPGLCLHAALLCVPEAIAEARTLLARHHNTPLIAEYDRALAVISGAADATTSPANTPESQARHQSLRWSLRHMPSPEVHVGLPARVLRRALDEAGIAGTTLECGVYFGRSLRLIAAQTRGSVHGFDSFEGLPEAWNPREGAGAYSTGGRLPRVADNVILHRGWFEDTLPPFFARCTDPIRLLHVDCDLYSSTRTVLDAASDRLVAGSIIVFDDLLGYPGHEAHELRAFEEFVVARRIRWEPIAACLLGREVAIRILD